MLEMLNLQGTIFLLVIVGFLLRKLKIVGKEGQKCITDLVIDVILPCNIIKAFCVDFTDQMGQEMLYVVILSAVVQVLAVIYGKLVFRKASPGKQKSLRYGIICSNAGFLGNPIAEGVYGSYGLLLASVFLIPLRIMMWTEGVSIYSGSTNPKQALKKAATHPCIVACFIGLILMFSGLRFPTMVSKTIGYFASCNTAMSMLIIGLILGDMDPKKLIESSVIVYTIHRLLLMPLIIYGITWLLPISSTVRGVVVLLTAMPAGATTSILASKYDQEPEYATKLVIFSTLLSLPSLALWSLVLI